MNYPYLLIEIRYISGDFNLQVSDAKGLVL